MRPINRRFFVKLDGTNGASSVIALPDSLQGPQNIGVVTHAHDGHSDVHVGDRVMLGRFGGNPLPGHDGMVWVTEADVLAIL
jgi:co-chaperonin GroES (HSP10)